MEWINDVDMLADAGVINFDAASRILGTQPRYIGHPEIRHLPGDFEYFYAPLKEDRLDFTTKPFKPDDNPTWKKVLFGGVVTAAVIGALLHGKKLKNLDFKKLSKTLKINAKLAFCEMKIISKKLGNKITSIFKKESSSF